MKVPATKVLLVDDDLLIRQIYGRHLEKAGYAVLSAGNSEEALEMVKREVPQMIVLDVHLPGTSGLTLLRKLRDEEATKATPIIMITSLPDVPTCKEAAKACNATAFLTKPFSPKQLLTEIQQALQA